MARAARLLRARRASGLGLALLFHALMVSTAIAMTMVASRVRGASVADDTRSRISASPSRRGRGSCVPSRSRYRSSRSPWRSPRPTTSSRRRTLLVFPPSCSGRTCTARSSSGPHSSRSRADRARALSSRSRPTRHTAAWRVPLPRCALGLHPRLALRSRPRPVLPHHPRRQPRLAVHHGVAGAVAARVPTRLLRRRSGDGGHRRLAAPAARSLRPRLARDHARGALRSVRAVVWFALALALLLPLALDGITRPGADPARAPAGAPAARGHRCGPRRDVIFVVTGTMRGTNEAGPAPPYGGRARVGADAGRRLGERHLRRLAAVEGAEPAGRLAWDSRFELLTEESCARSSTSTGTTRAGAPSRPIRSWSSTASATECRCGVLKTTRDSRHLRGPCTFVVARSAG